MSLSARGILHPRAAAESFRISRPEPSADLAPFIERYWLITWDLRDRPPHSQDTLPYPCVNVVFEQHGCAAWGTSTRKFTKVLEGQGSVFGVKMRPGGFYPFVRFPIVHLTDASRSLGELFGDIGSIERDVMECTDDPRKIQLVEDFFRARLPAADPEVDVVSRVVQVAHDSRELVTVNALADHVQISPRTLQRVFRRYVGVSPKWVIRRFRIHEAAERADRGDTDWAQMAQDLGYVDQSHFIRDFKDQVGKSPSEYAKAQT
jgi:AraC-like DNA-binding protein